ncbi:hypothetical protein ACM41_26455 [Bradyrhizobium sp. CCBAU 21362]|uniref:hypothetical protein n=1 Tax=Bradyrhizobium sp. CCBAU 21362 TaxID=1325082 RepID=UPI00230510A4|nr:hypothetical protein [Bradyrhizobium sp. CCBAU 21362]MDA9539645.1 hypothetical protein [Bradyrhizobium sp. CCBAU 21362]
MASSMENPAALAAHAGLPVTDLAGASIKREYALETLRKQYLAEVFALPTHTACTIAELAFGEASR